MKQHYDIIIVGAGISGLSCAYKCQQNDRDFILFEKSNRVGGRVGSVKENGFIFDVGFQVYNTAYKTTNELLDLDVNKFGRFSPGAKIFVNGKSTILSDPLRNVSKLPNTLLSRAGTILDKIKILQLKLSLNKYEIKHDQTNDVSTIEFLENYGFSEKIIKNFFQPFFSGIFLENELKTSSKFFKYVFSNFNNGIAALPQNGMQEIPDDLSSKLNASRLKLNSEVVKIDNNNFIELKNGDRIGYKYLILTNESSMLAEDGQIDYNPTSTIYFSSRLNVDDGSYIHLFPEEDLINNIAIVSEVVPTYSQDDLSLFSISLKKKYKKEKHDILIRQKLAHYFGGKDSDYTFEKSFSIIKGTIKQRVKFFDEEKNFSSKYIVCGDYFENGSIEGASISGIKAYEQLKK